MHHSKHKMRADNLSVAFGVATPLVTATATVASATTIGRWQPLESQIVLDLEIIYGRDVMELFTSSWNPWVDDVNYIYPDLTYTVPYQTALPTATIAASILWSPTSNDSLTTTMHLKIPNNARWKHSAANVATATSSDAMSASTGASTETLSLSSTFSTTPGTVPVSESGQNQNSRTSSIYYPTSSMLSNTSNISSNSTSTASSAPPISASNFASPSAVSSTSDSSSVSTPAFTSGATLTALSSFASTSSSVSTSTSTSSTSSPSTSTSTSISTPTSLINTDSASASPSNSTSTSITKTSTPTFTSIINSTSISFINSTSASASIPSASTAVSASDTSSVTTSSSDSTLTSAPTPSSAPSPPAEDKNDCHGVSGDYWVMSRDVAVTNAETFCGQGEKIVKYNENSVNELELSVSQTDDDTRSPKDDPNCLSRLRDSVIDGCDGNDAEKNPHNYKFGSKLTSSDGWVYEMKPLSKQINEVSCDVTWQFFDDFFEIRGKNVPDATLGANGEGLKKQLRGCGSLTAWNFQPTPQDVKFQWKASGQLPVGTRRCVGNALKSAGGADQGNCRGLGLRSHLS